MLPAFYITASFTEPIEIGTNPQSMLWLLPLVATIAIVYKATKLPKITAVSFVKEAVMLFGSIIIFMLVTAVVLYILAWLITQ